MSKYSDQYTEQQLRDMGESNRRHVLSEEQYQAFEDEVMHPKPKAKTASTHHTTTSTHVKEVEVNKPKVDRIHPNTSTHIKEVEADKEVVVSSHLHTKEAEADRPKAKEEDKKYGSAWKKLDKRS